MLAQLVGPWKGHGGRPLQRGGIMVPQKVQLESDDLKFIETACAVLNYRSKSEFMRMAIREKIRADRRRLRELKRRKAMAGYGGDFDVAFESIEGEDFESR